MAETTRTVRLEVCRDDVWEWVTFEEIDRLSVACAPKLDGSGITLTLIGERSGKPNVVEAQIVDIAERHRSLLDSDIPTVNLDGEAVLLPIAFNADES